MDLWSNFLMLKNMWPFFFYMPKVFADVERAWGCLRTKRKTLNSMQAPKMMLIFSPWLSSLNVAFFYLESRECKEIVKQHCI